MAQSKITQKTHKAISKNIIPYSLCKWYGSPTWLVFLLLHTLFCIRWRGNFSGFRFGVRPRVQAFHFTTVNKFLNFGLRQHQHMFLMQWRLMQVVKLGNDDTFSFIYQIGELPRIAAWYFTTSFNSSCISYTPKVFRWCKIRIANCSWPGFPVGIYMRRHVTYLRTSTRHVRLSAASNSYPHSSI